jgi:hypothetical protein
MSRKSRVFTRHRGPDPSNTGLSKAIIVGPSADNATRRGGPSQSQGLEDTRITDGTEGPGQP